MIKKKIFNKKLFDNNVYISIYILLLNNIYNMWNEINFRDINEIKLVSNYISDENYHQLMQVYIKNSIGNIINIDYTEQIENIKNHQDLINFISIFKWKSESEKLSFIYFQKFTKQMLLYIKNIRESDKMKIYADIFWEFFQGNEYDENGHFFSTYMCALDEDKGSKFMLYYWEKLLKGPVEEILWWYTKDEINNFLL